MIVMLHVAPAHCASLPLNTANDVAPEHDLVETHLACADCGRPCVIALPGSRPLAEELRVTRCPVCRLPGSLTPVRAPKEAA